MSKKLNFLIILAIFFIPIILYFVVKAPNDNGISKIAIASTNKPTIINFSSNMCLECQELAEVYDPLKEKYKNQVNFKKLSVNTNSQEVQKLTQKYNVNVVPTLVFLNKNGEVVRRTEGSLPKSTLESYIQSLING